MEDSKKKGQQHKKPPADSPRIAKILAEARHMVDDLSRESPPPTKASPTRQAASPRTRSQTGRAPKPASKKKGPAAPKAASPPKIQPAPPSKARPPWVAAPRPGPGRSPQEYGIRVVHALPGRVRLRIRSLKFNPQFAAELELKLAALTGVTEVAASSTTGSLLICYRSGGLAADPLGDALETWFPELDTDMLLASLPS